MLRSRVGVTLLVGAAAAPLLPVLPAYAAVLVLAGTVLGVVFGGHPVLTGALLGGPALVAAGWLAPRGDDDGLWLLWYPVVVWWAAMAALAHAVAVAAVARFRHRRADRA